MDYRYPLGVLVGLLVGSLLFFMAPDLPSNGEIGFLGVVLLAHYAFKIVAPIAGVVACVLFILILKKPAGSPGAPTESEK